MKEKFKEMDMKEIEFADTVFIRDIDSRVFQAITFKTLLEIEGVALPGAGLIDNLLGRETTERIRGITVEQDQKNHAVNIKIELNIAFGVSIPEKAEEIQTSVARDISKLTGLHVGCVHVIFKNMIAEGALDAILEDKSEPATEKEIEDVLEKQHACSYSEEL
ncbi:MAG: Asp23/Gls24 family envelope stress response protein [Simkaniaceae bacterium]|nr:Asp23/Gls24 family envelope stress response protein [Simkaniaceae bacterium]